MSEYWVSHKKYFCKYCNIYIADDKPSRTQHETGLRHKGNVERFVRGLYKAGEKRKQDLEEEKREMARIERVSLHELLHRYEPWLTCPQAAAASYAQDVGAGLVKPGSSSAALPTQPQAGPSKPARPSDAYANYSTAASLGYTDPDEERRKAEAEQRRNEGVIGAWEVVAVDESAPVEEEAEEEAEEQKVKAEGDAVAATAAPEPPTLKREAEAPLDDDDDARQFKLRRKKLNTGLGEIYDPGLIPIKLKAKKEELAEPTLPKEEEATSAPIRFAPALVNPNATAVPQWSARGWSKPGETKAKQAEVPPETEQPAPTQPATAEPDVTAVDPSVPAQNGVAVHDKASEVKTEAPPEVKKEPDTIASMAPPSLFKKRKTPAGSAGSRGRMP